MIYAKRAPVSEYMSHPLLFACTDESISAAYARMREGGVQQLLVLEDGRLVGILYDSDLALLHYLPGRAAERVPVAAVMETDFCTVGPRATVESVARVMCKGQCRAALVLDDELPVGIFTVGDALHGLSDALTVSLPDAASAA